MTQDEMVGWYHRLNGHGSVWTPGVGDGQGGLGCCSSWGCMPSTGAAAGAASCPPVPSPPDSEVPTRPPLTLMKLLNQFTCSWRSSVWSRVSASYGSQRRDGNSHLTPGLAHSSIRHQMWIWQRPSWGLCAGLWVRVLCPCPWWYSG